MSTKGKKNQVNRRSFLKTAGSAVAAVASPEALRAPSAP